MTTEKELLEFLIKIGQVVPGSKPPEATSPEKEDK